MTEKRKQVQNWAGTIIALGGIVLAIWHPDLAIPALIAALIGAGAIDPSMVANLFRK